MSLPGGGAWPPKPNEIAFTQQAIWDAWLKGDAEALRSAYGEAGAAGNVTRTKERSFEPLTSRQGGIVPTIARLFWGRTSTSGSRKAGLHVPMASDIATASADMLFSEPPQFLLDTVEAPQPQVAAGKTTTKTPADLRIDEVLNNDDFHAELIEAAEVCAALGGGWMRLVWDGEVAERVMVDAVAADCAYGEWRWGILEAVTFFTEYSSGNGNREVIRHLERHEKEAILHGLYRGDDKTLGTRIALNQHESTANLAGSEGELAGAMELIVPTGVKSLTAAYVANMRPQRRWRKVDALANLGRSDYDGVEALMDALDETYTSWMRDVRLGKARLIVPASFLEDLGKGQGLGWDEDKEVYTGLKMMADNPDGRAITSHQFEIRVAQHRDTADALIDQILDAAGYSPGTFGRGVEGMATATEVVSRERKSERTRDKKSRYWSQALGPLLSTWLELDGIVFGGNYKGSVKIKWSESSQADPLRLAQTAQSLRIAEAASTKTLVAMNHPDWDEAEIDTEVEKILKESGRSVPEPEPFA